MNEIISVDEQFDQIVGGFDTTTAEELGIVDTPIEVQVADSTVAPTTFETLARTPDAIRDNMTRLVVANSTTDYTMPEGEKD